MAKKLRVGILFGGRSGEHEVSLLSAASVLRAIDRDKFDVTPIGITREGRWLAAADANHLLNGDMSAVVRRLRAGDPDATPGAKLLHEGIPTLLAPVPGPQGPEGNAIDVVFPVLHGTFGEDGTIQGLFELAGIAYVGSGVLGSAAGMDKDVMKRLFIEAGLPIVNHVTLLRADWEKNPRKAIAQVEKSLRYPVFVKPANLGSSVGISKAHDRKELGPALAVAAKYDRKLVVEQGVGGKKARAREFEVAVLGNDNPKASVVGEIVPGKEFYDYEAKYLSEGSVPVIPAELSRAETKKITRDGRRRLPRLRPCGPGARGLPDGARWQAAHLCERGEHHARLHANQHVPQAVGGLGPRLHGSDHAPHRASPRAPGGEEQDDVQQGLGM